jgi:hypothetical protein
MTKATSTETAPTQRQDDIQQPPPAAYRRLIMEILSDAGPDGVTLSQVEKAVGKALGTRVHDSIEDQVHGLIDWDLVLRRERRLHLTDEGARYVRGVRAMEQAR